MQRAPGQDRRGVLMMMMMVVVNGYGWTVHLTLNPLGGRAGRKLMTLKCELNATMRVTSLVLPACRASEKRRWRLLPAQLFNSTVERDDYCPRNDDITIDWRVVTEFSVVWQMSK